ncbi:peptidase M20 domain-containing protein 2 [Aplysia californica]|uniref:Peptidase M20 domain-containing protein 2 n=1 Tax=Aplysia californica TaxID=6500 RepID=A0ABM1AA40_APLCA|nr:peptidase M20 domain-containing protein 2 [Aplysia californica]
MPPQLEMDNLKKIVCDAIDKESEQLCDLSSKIWHLKELAYQEHQSHATLTQFFLDRGFEVVPHHVIETAFVATFETSSGAVEGTQKKPHVAVICEYDALPEIGHACGHNLIAELGVAAGLGIKAALEQNKNISGKLSIIGTPAEEGGGGKIDLINAGVFDGVDVAMMAHPAPFTDARPTFLASKRFIVDYHGRASHAGGFPWEGVNALDAAVLGYMNVAALRQQMRPTWRVHTIITKGGVKTNVIPDETQLSLQIRAPIDSECKLLETKVKQCLTASATASGCTVDITDSKKPYESLITNNTLATLYETNGAAVGVEFPPTSPKKVLGSTDMGNVSHRIPSLHPTYDIGTDAVNHTHEFTTATGSQTAQSFTIAQGKALAMVALDIFQKPELLLQIRKDFEEDMKNL